jgi:hypothetical protein
MVGALASELVFLLADSVQLGGQIFPKVTEECRDDDEDRLL